MRALAFVSALGFVSALAPVARPWQQPSVPMAESRPLSRGLGLDGADSVVADWVDSERIPGAVLLVAKDGEVVLERAYGWSRLHEYGRGQYGASTAGAPASMGLQRLADPVRMTTSTVFDLASVTKVMATTMAVMLLIESGDMELDAPLHHYLPDFRGDGKDEVTLRLLLTHRAGLAQWLPIYYHAENRDQAYEYIRTRPLSWEAGEARHYSDLGFMLLGLAVESVTGTSLDAFLRARVYAPLGLERTGFRPRGATGAGAARSSIASTSHGNPYEQRMVHDSTFGYRISGDPNAWGGWRRHTLNGEVNDGNAFHAFDGIAGHAGLFSTASDLSVILQLLMDGGEYRGRRYLSPGVVDMFLTSTGRVQGLGWQFPGHAPPSSFSHTGFTGTFVMGVREHNVAIVLLTNRQNGGVSLDGSYPDVLPLQRAVVASVMDGIR